MRQQPHGSVNLVDAILFKAAAPQTHDIDAVNLDAPLVHGTRERQHILGNHGVTANIGVAPHAAELVNAAEGADGGVVFDDDVARQGGPVAQDGIVAYQAIVGNVHVGHDQVEAAQPGQRAPTLGAAMDADELADAVVVANDDFAALAAELQVLGNKPDGAEGEDAVALPDAGRPLDDYVGADVGFLADFNLRPDGGVGAHTDRGRQARPGVDHGGGMNAHGLPGWGCGLALRARSRSTRVAIRRASVTNRSPT